MDGKPRGIDVTSERENLMFWWQTATIESGLDVPNANTILSTIFQKEPSFGTIQRVGKRI
jgi:hypothetical protein